MNTEDEDLIEEWFLIRNIKEGTQKTYTKSMKDYCNLLKKSPIELMEEAEKEEVSLIRIRNRKVSKHLLKYKKSLQNSGKAPGTVNLYFSAIKSFYKAFDITLPEIKMAKGDIGLEKNIGRPLTREIILQFISAAPVREKALIYLMALSGMGQEEARNLTIKKFIDSASAATKIPFYTLKDLFQHEEKILQEVLTLELRREKPTYRHHTFIPPEASREIIAYLKERNFGRNKKIRIKSLNEPIFINRDGGILGEDSIVTNFRRIGQDAGFQKDKGAYSWWRSHSLRKYFISTIINKRGEKIIADYMAGHKINDQDRTYWQANPGDLKEKYLSALPYLSIDGAKVKDLDTDQLKKFMEDSEKKDKEIDALEKKVNVLESLVDDLITRNGLNKPKD